MLLLLLLWVRITRQLRGGQRRGLAARHPAAAAAAAAVANERDITR